MPGERCSPQTSLTILAPASAAATATSSLLVSIETVTPAPARPSTMGSTRRISSSAATGAWPGRVDSPPTSTRSAPASTMARPRSIARPGSLSPSPLKESGEALTMPITRTGAVISAQYAQAGMLLSDLAAGAPGAAVETGGACDVRRVVQDSRVTGPGDLFVAVRGLRHDGHDFAAEAARAGAAVAVERPVPLPPGTPSLRLADSRWALGELAATAGRRGGCG